eukprot:g47928.t1
MTKRSSVLETVNKIEQREHNSEKFPNNRRLHYSSDSLMSGHNSSARSSLNCLDDMNNRYSVAEGQPAKQPSTSMSNLITADKTPILHHLTCENREAGTKVEELRRQDGELQLPAKSAQKSKRASLPIQNKGGQLSKSRSSIQLMDKGEEDTLWEDDLSGSPPDNAFNRAYRNSLKDAQSKVLRATSFRRKDLDLTSPYVNKPSIPARPASAHVGSVSQPKLLHVPKERHCLTPTEVRNPNPDFSSKELQNSHHVARIGNRKRLTAEQKKRSFSEPEKINELGVSDSEISFAAQHKPDRAFTFPEATELQSVADRRRLFEREGRTLSTVNLSKPELKQIQQNALADYIHRKTGKRPFVQETGVVKERSQSVYLQPSRSDDQSLSSCSSMSSLLDQSVYGRQPLDRLPETARVSSTLPPGLPGNFDLYSSVHQADNRASLNRYRMNMERSYGSELTLNKIAPQEPVRPSNHSHQNQSHHQQQLAFDRQSSARNSGKFASADNLLERSENPVAVHIRSRSSPSTEMISELVAAHTKEQEILDLVMCYEADFGELKVKKPLEGSDLNMKTFTLKFEGEKLESDVTVLQLSKDIYKVRETRVNIGLLEDEAGAIVMGNKEITEELNRLLHKSLPRLCLCSPWSRSGHNLLPGLASQVSLGLVCSCSGLRPLLVSRTDLVSDSSALLDVLYAMKRPFGTSTKDSSFSKLMGTDCMGSIHGLGNLVGMDEFDARCTINIWFKNATSVQTTAFRLRATAMNWCSDSNAGANKNRKVLEIFISGNICGKRTRIKILDLKVEQLVAIRVCVAQENTLCLKYQKA